MELYKYKKAIWGITFKSFLVVLGLQLILLVNVNAQLQYNTVLQDNMVIQQEKPFRICGKGIAGEEVHIKVSWSETEYNTTIAADGNWEYELPSVPKAVPGDFTPQKIETTSSGEKITLQNLLIGDVWFFAGQSNMAMTMAPELPWHNGILNYPGEISKANYPNIRLFKTVINEVGTPADDVEGQWQACSGETVKYFSAVAYCMGETLHKELNIPVGLILSSKGAMSAQAFTSKETLQGNTELYNKYLKPYEDGLVTDPGAVPCQLYNSIIYPFRKLSLKGFCWCQGVNNAGDGSIYTSLCAEMVKGWRIAFDQNDLPFYYIQAAPYNFGTSFFNSAYADLREWQANIRNTLTNSDMVVTLDLNYPANIHPSNKRPVGERLAALALKETYGQGSRVACGPRYKSMSIEGNKVIVEFEATSVGSGLNTNDGETPRHFFIAGADKKFYLATPEIIDDKVELTAPEVSEPVAVRYAYLMYPVTNFQNVDGFPAEPFRTDAWTPYEPSYDESRGGNKKLALTVRDDGSGNYTNITSAMYDADSGDTIDILGTFTENLLITYPLKSNVVFKGHGSEATIIQQASAKPLEINGTSSPTITIGNGLNISFSDLCIRYGASPTFGGGILLNTNVGGKVTIERCSVSDNLAAYYGGGIASLGSNINIVDCSVTNNSALLGGGGIFTASSNDGENSKTLIDRCLVAGNSATLLGAGIYADGNGSWGNQKTLETVVQNTTIAFNNITNVEEGFTSGLFLQSTRFISGGVPQDYTNHRCRIINSTIACNVAGKLASNYGSGFGAYSDGLAYSLTKLSVYNSIIALNKDNTGAENIFADIHLGNMSVDTVAYCLLGKEIGLNKAFSTVHTESNLDNDVLKLSDELKDLGGYSRVLPLETNSVAIGYIPSDIVNSSPTLLFPKVDQRGYERKGDIDCGAFQTSSFPLSAPEMMKNQENISVYTDNEKLYINRENIGKIEIYDLLGRMWINEENKSVVSISQLKSGMYIVRVFRGTQRQSLKIIKN